MLLAQLPQAEFDFVTRPDASAPVARRSHQSMPKHNPDGNNQYGDKNCVLQYDMMLNCVADCARRST